LLKLIIGNRAYSSWSMRGWLAVKHSGEEFEEFVVPLFDSEWEQRREGDEFAPSLGKVPILWDGDCVVWDSLAIIDFLADRHGRDLFWPANDGARGMARSMAAEMHSSFAALRREHSMNIRQIYPAVPPSEPVAQDIARIMQLWAQARARYGGDGDFLFGQFGAVDLMFAPVVTRFITYQLPVARFADAYMRAIIAHPWMSGYALSTRTTSAAASCGVSTWLKVPTIEMPGYFAASSFAPCTRCCRFGAF
jgi:glutathione S-transferase